MKKILLTLCMVLSLTPAAWAGNPSGKIRTLVNEYRDEPGFEVVDMGGLALGLLRAAARTQVETPEDRKALDLFSSVKRLTVLDFSDAEVARKDKFLQRNPDGMEPGVSHWALAVRINSPSWSSRILPWRLIRVSSARMTIFSRIVPAASERP